jgi:hypothetical protein
VTEPAAVVVGDAVVIGGRLAALLSPANGNAGLRGVLEAEARRSGLSQLHPDVVELLACVDVAGRRHRHVARVVDHFRRAEDSVTGVRKPSDGAGTLTAVEAAGRLNLSPRRVRQYVDEGQLHPVDRRRPMRFDEREVQAMVEVRAKRSAA